MTPLRAALAAACDAANEYEPEDDCVAASFLRNNRAELLALLDERGALRQDAERLQYLIDQFILTDNAWMATFCYSADKNGIRAAIDAARRDGETT